MNTKTAFRVDRLELWGRKWVEVGAVPGPNGGIFTTREAAEKRRAGCQLLNERDFFVVTAFAVPA